MRVLGKRKIKKSNMKLKKCIPFKVFEANFKTGFFKKFILDVKILITIFK